MYFKQVLEDLDPNAKSAKSIAAFDASLHLPPKPTKESFYQSDVVDDLVGSRLARTDLVTRPVPWRGEIDLKPPNTHLLGLADIYSRAVNNNGGPYG